MKQKRNLFKFLAIMMLLLLPSLALSGCGGGGSGSSSSGTGGTTSGGGSSPQTVSGSVFGGTVAISGATVYLYAVGSSGAATLLGSNTTANDGTGDFTITLTSTPPTGSVLYVVTHGGTTAGLSVQIQLAAFVGSGSSNISGIAVNELSTAASSIVAYYDLNTGTGSSQVINYNDTSSPKVMVLNGATDISNVMSDYNAFYNNTDTLQPVGTAGSGVGTTTKAKIEQTYTFANLILNYIQGGASVDNSLNTAFTGGGPTDTFNAFDLVADNATAEANLANYFNGSGISTTTFFFSSETGADMSTVFNGSTY
ncbi:MAG: hypothetical protein ACYCSQ_09115 [bacterium]